jgi:hypothetical protein
VYCRLFVITPNLCLPRTVKQRYYPTYVHWLYYVRVVDPWVTPRVRSDSSRARYNGGGSSLSTSSLSRQYCHWPLPSQLSPKRAGRSVMIESYDERCCRRSRNIHVRSPNVCRRFFTGSILFALLLSRCGS